MCAILQLVSAPLNPIIVSSFEYGRAPFASALPFPGSKCLSRICITGSNSLSSPRV